MRKILLGGVAAALLALAAPAQAHPTYHYIGGCGFPVVSEVGDGDRTREAYAVVVATDVAGAPSPTTSISVECDVYKNGVFQGTSASGSGTGVAVAASPTTPDVYEAAPEDIITICERVTVGGQPHTKCGHTIYVPIVPEPVQEAIEGILDTVDEIVVEHGDPTLCEVFKALAPGVAGVLDITPEGDVYVAGEFFWDCFPYAS